MNLTNNPNVQHVVEGLLADERIHRVLNFANGVFKLYAPNLHDYYEATLQRLCESDTSLERNSAGSCFTAVTFNLGPQTATHPYLDHMNLPWGWCSVMAHGDFDHRRSGQVVLWNLKKVIEVPPGATIFIPSAVIEHSNLALQPGEQHLFIMQYTAGALFRWVESGFCHLSDLSKDDQEEID
ncbi:hypothetical protein ONZ51_g11832 [Trametes cubensis]|uniref:Uncharacterized protein n=1 Tax=Trametes cubensis TaxID=1111947 RepID=A0AAD7THE4_9APHY|nr:hypothetical protein ONZ51_g11832 [Trametes cubensis]